MTDAGGGSKVKQSECLKIWRKLSLNCVSSEVPATLRCAEEASERSSSSGAPLSTQPDHEAAFTLQRLQITDDVCRFESWRWCNAVVLQEFTSLRSSSARVAAAAHHHPVGQTQTAELDSAWQIHDIHSVTFIYKSLLEMNNLVFEEQSFIHRVTWRINSF